VKNEIFSNEIPLPEVELRRLLDVLCVEWGFCIPSKASEDICRHLSPSANEFATAVLRAEGMNPEYEKKWFLRIRDRFVEEFVERITSDAHEVELKSEVP